METFQKFKNICFQIDVKNLFGGNIIHDYEDITMVLFSTTNQYQFELIYFTQRGVRGGMVRSCDPLFSLFHWPFGN